MITWIAVAAKPGDENASPTLKKAKKTTLDIFAGLVFIFSFNQMVDPFHSDTSAISLFLLNTLPLCF